MIIAMLPALLLALTPQCSGTAHPPVACPSFISHTAATMAAAAGKPFTSKEGGFSITLPSGFAAFESRSTSGNVFMQPESGDLTTHSFLSESRRGKSMSMLVVMYTDYPAEMIAATNSSTMLDSAVNWLTKNFSSTVDGRREVTLSSFPGRSATFHGGDKYAKVAGRMDCYLVNTRLYKVVIMTASQTKAQLNTKAASAAFSSFKLTNAGKAK